MKIKILVSYTSNNYCANVYNIPCFATGKTLTDVKNNISSALDFHLEGLELNNETLPIKRGDYKLIVKYIVKYNKKHKTSMK